MPTPADTVAVSRAQWLGISAATQSGAEPLHKLIDPDDAAARPNEPAQLTDEPIERRRTTFEAVPA